MPEHVLSLYNYPFAWGIWAGWAPSNTCFFGPIRVQKPNSISIS